jgi:hypothetical protein
VMDETNCQHNKRQGSIFITYQPKHVPTKKPHIKEKYLFGVLPNVNAPVTIVMKRQIIDICHATLGLERFVAVVATIAPGIVPISTTKKKSETSVAFITEIHHR